MPRFAKHCRQILAGALLATVLYGCGMRGDLYLRDKGTDSAAKPISTEGLDAESRTTDQTATEDRQGFSEAPAETEAEYKYDDQRDDGQDETAITADGEYDSVTPPLP